jgi:hypothetical protein
VLDLSFTDVVGSTRRREHEDDTMPVFCGLDGLRRGGTIQVNYDDAIASFAEPQPMPDALPEAVANPSPARRLRDACEPIAMHPVWSRYTNERLAELGLDFLTSYVGGRAAYLGDPAESVVAATFAWFEPSLVAGMYQLARQAAGREQLMATRAEATVLSLRTVLGDDDPSAVADALAEATEAADGMGRPLFSGVRATGRPIDPVERLWWAATLVREHRGDSHVAAAAAAGIGPVEMNLLTEQWLGMALMSYAATRGWSPEALQKGAVRLEERGWMRGGRITESGAEARSRIEESTDIQEQSIVDGLGDRLADVCEQLEGWARRCIEAGTFPNDALKRAAG